MQIGSNLTDSIGFGSLHTLSYGNTSSSFASLIAGRAVAGQTTQVENAAETGQIASSGAENQGLGQDKRGRSGPSQETAAKLESALAGSIDYIADKFGNAAATTAMGIILKRVGDGPVDEQSLGNGFLSAIKFVDQQFGVEQGDKFINELNGSLNESLNAFFDNGLNEKFLASTTPLGGTSINGLTLTASGSQDSATQSIVSDLKSMLEDLQKNRPGETQGKAGELNGQYKNYASPYFEAPILEPGLVVDAMV